MVAFVVLLVLAVAGVASGMLLFWRILRPASPDLPAAAERARLLSIVIPARNEERRLPALLESLAPAGRAGRSGETEILVVDDESSDATRAVAESFGCRVIEPGPRPAGWIGKSWACWRGALAAAGDALLFLDADTTLERDGLGTLERLFAVHRGLLSIQPYHRAPTAGEHLSALFNAVVVAGTSAFRAFSESADGGFGPCMLIGRADYFRVGGHRSVRASLIEDMALARTCAARGVPVSLLPGKGIISFRMYPGGVAEIVEGWTKNLSSGASSARAGTTLLITLWLTGGLSALLAMAFVALIAVAGGGQASPVGFFAVPALATAVPAALMTYLLSVSAVGLVTSRLGSFGVSSALLYPIHLLFFFAVFIRSLFLTRVRGEVSWKGRIIRLAGGQR